jgi:hypothetical protein
MSNLLKILAAFAAGVVVALGGALIYVRASEMLHPPPMVRSVSANDTAADNLPVTQPQQNTANAVQQLPAPSAPTPAPVHKTAKKQAPAAAIRTTPAAVPVVKSAPAAAERLPIQIAQNTQPSPVASPAPESSSNESFAMPQAPPPSGYDQQAQPQAQAAPAPAPTPLQQPHTVTLPAGTTIAVRLGETLSTDHNYTGDTFRGTLQSQIVQDGFIIADRGSKVLGRIVNASKAGHLEGAADLNLTVTEINTTDGQRVSVQTNTNDRKGPTNTGQQTAKIAGGAALGAIIGAVAGGGKGAAIGAGAGGAAGTGAVMLSHTKAAVFEAETVLYFRLGVPVTLTEKLNN